MYMTAASFPMTADLSSFAINRFYRPNETVKIYAVYFLGNYSVSCFLHSNMNVPPLYFKNYTGWFIEIVTNCCMLIITFNDLVNDTIDFM